MAASAQIPIPSPKPALRTLRPPLPDPAHPNIILPIEDPRALEEERRLFYVGVTRCMDELYLTYPEMRLGAGYDQTFHSPSRFLREVPESLFEAWDVRQAPPVLKSRHEEDGENPF